MTGGVAQREGTVGAGAGPCAFPAAVGVLESPLPSRAADYAVLFKARLTMLVLFVTAAGFCLGSPGPVDPWLLIHTVLGTALVAAGASALNQYSERGVDRLMRRTAQRPIPAGRISPAEALGLGIACAFAGIAYLAWKGGPWPTALAAATIALYLFAYTPLKRRTWLNTLVGAIPGALPPLIGFSAASDGITGLGLVLFLLLFIWQLPHFFAIAWMYREDYARAGHRMLSVVDPSGRSTGRQTIIYCAALLAMGFVPTILGEAGIVSALGATGCGLAWLVIGVRFARKLTDSSARLSLQASLIYLPTVMMLLLLDRASG